jgi:hypothetical protein
MKQSSLGTYLGRDVDLILAADLVEIDPKAGNGAVTLLWIGPEAWNKENLEQLVEALCRAGVLGISLCGYNADESFSTVLDYLGRVSSPQHVMTSVFHGDIGEAFEKFLLATVPDDSSFENWRRYLTMATISLKDQPTFLELVRQVAARHCHNGKSGSA